MSTDIMVQSIRNLSDEDVVQRVLGDTQKAVGNKKGDIIRNKRYRLIYQALDPPGDTIEEATGPLTVEDESKYSDNYLAIGAATVDTAVTAVYNHLFSIPDYMEIIADEWEDELIAKKVTAHLMKRHKETKYKTKVFETLQACMSYDYAVTLTKWEMRPGYIRKRVIEKGTKKLGKFDVPYQDVSIQTEWVVNAVDRSTIEQIDYFACAHDQNSKNGFEDSTYFIDWRRVPISELELMAETPDRPWGKYKNIDKVLEAATKIGNNEIDAVDPVDRDSSPNSDRVLVVRYWTPDHVVEVAADQVISRQDLDGWPLQLWKCYRNTGEFKGMGVVQRMERNQYDLNALLNIRRDFQNITLTPITVADEDLLAGEEGDIELYPGRTIPNATGKSAKDVLQVIQPGVDLSGSANAEIGTNFDMIKMVTHQGENQMGSYSSGRKTARETVAVSAGSLSHAALIGTLLEVDCLEPGWERQFLLEQSYLSKEESFKYMGPEGQGFLVIRPEDYRWSALPRFMAKGSSYLVQRDLQIQQFMSGLQIAMQLPQLHNIPALVSKMWSYLAPEDYLNFMRDPRDKTHNVPPEMEHVALAHGHDVEVSPENDHQAHRAAHSQVKSTADYRVWPQMFKDRLENHEKQHEQVMNQAQQPQAPPQQGQDSSDIFRGMRGTAVR